MIAYIVKRPFSAGSRPDNLRQYRPGDELTQGDVDMWMPGEFAAVMGASSIEKTEPSVTPAPRPPELAAPPEPAHQS